MSSMPVAHTLRDRVYAGQAMSREDVLPLFTEDLTLLKSTACEIRRFYSKNELQFRGQVVVPWNVPVNPDMIHKEFYSLIEHGARRIHLDFQHNTISQKVVEILCERGKSLFRRFPVYTTICHAKLNYAQFRSMFQAGYQMYYEFMGMSRKKYPETPSPYLALSYDEKIALLETAKSAGLGIGSGGFVGMGETTDDFLDLIFTLREQGITALSLSFSEYASSQSLSDESVSMEELLRRAAIVRFILPNAVIAIDLRHVQLPNQGQRLWEFGINGVTSGIESNSFDVNTEDDMDVSREFGFIIV